jgi:protein tyrosine/serine phosphatase
MSSYPETRQIVHRFSPRITFLALTIALLFTSASAQSSSDRIEGVTNFGSVTGRFFRGGQITPAGIEKLAAKGTRTIIDLRDKESPGEAEACQRNGIKYYKFPMNGHAAPEPKMVNEILSIIQSAKEPVYVHCSAGKHRAGTITALYRMRVQGWSKEQAWAEQQSYGFGTPEEHPELYAFVYGGSSQPARTPVQRVAARTTILDDNTILDDKEKSSKTKKKKDEVSSRSKKDDDDDDDDDGDKHKGGKRKQADKEKGDTETDVAGAETEPASNSVANAKAKPKNETASSAATAGLSSAADYISLSDAVKRSRAEGGSADVLKVDLEWDEVRSLVTWDLTFSSGTEYEFDASTGKLLGTKSKAPAKLAVLLPLELNGKRLFTFQEIIKKVENSKGQSVVEMELKRIKGRSETIFEVVLADGTTLYYDAVTGEAVSGS